MKQNDMFLNAALACLLLASAFSVSAIAQGHSTYAGQEKREIKALSSRDITALKRGNGWGFAKAAELNGLPGPLHLLQMKAQIALTPNQIERITKIYDQMKTEAIALGTTFVELERALDRALRRGPITQAALRAHVRGIADVRAQLRTVHLSAHLKVHPLLTVEQIAAYNRLRGYHGSDPCASTPKGHDAAMWRKHNNCD